MLTHDPATDDWQLFSAIRKEELLDAIRASRAQVVNVLAPPETGRLRMIAGSRHIPLAELASRARELDPAREVVVYCASYACNASREAARILADLGFHVRVYEGGIAEWTEAGLPTDADAPARAADVDVDEPAEKQRGEADAEPEEERARPA